VVILYLDTETTRDFRGMPGCDGLCITVKVLCSSCRPCVVFVKFVMMLVLVTRRRAGMQGHIRRTNDVGRHVCMFGVWKEAHVWRMERRMSDCRMF
jgi:hypothetical protein